MTSVSAPEVAGDAYQLYNAYQGFATSTGPSVSGVGAATTAVNVVGILNSNAQEEQKAQAVAEQVGLFVADCYTFGLASTAVKLCDKYCPWLTNTLRKIGMNEPVFKAVVGLFDTDKWKTEGNRLRKLEENGINIPASLQGPMLQKRGRTKEELIDHSLPLDFQGTTSDGRWVNNKFAMSRDEKDLAPQDIWGYATFFEKFGNDWLGKYSEADRTSIASKVLELGCAKEHHGTIDITWTPDLEKAVGEITKQKSVAH